MLYIIYKQKTKGKEMFNIYDESAKETVATGFLTYEAAEKEVYKMLADEVRQLIEDDEIGEMSDSLHSDLEDFENFRYGFSGRGYTDYSIYEVDKDGKFVRNC